MQPRGYGTHSLTAVKSISATSLLSAMDRPLPPPQLLLMLAFITLIGLVTTKVVNRTQAPPLPLNTCLQPLTPITTCLPPLTSVANSTIHGMRAAARTEDPPLLQVQVLISGTLYGQTTLVKRTVPLEERTVVG